MATVRGNRSRGAACFFLALVLISACGQLGASSMETVVAALSAVPTHPDPHPETSGLGSPAPDPDLPVQACGVAGRIDTAFVIPVGQRYDELVPALSGSTELDGDQGSLVLFYAGTATIKYLTGIPGASRDPTLQDVVCVITSDGQPNIYSNVSREGLIVPPASAFAVPVTDASICDALSTAPVCPRP